MWRIEVGLSCSLVDGKDSKWFGVRRQWGFAVYGWPGNWKSWRTAGQRALHTRFGHGSTFLFSPVAAAANGTFTASWSSSPRVSRHRGGGRRGEARRGEAIPEVDSRGRAPFDTGKERKCQIRGSAAVRRGFVRNRGRGDDDSTPPRSLSSSFFLLLLRSSIIIPSLAPGESFNDDFDDLNEPSVNMLIRARTSFCVCVILKLEFERGSISWFWNLDWFPAAETAF